MKYIVMTALTLGVLSFNAECGNFFEDIGRGVRDGAKTVVKEGGRIVDQADDKVQQFGNFIRNEAVPTVKQELKNAEEYFKEEVRPTFEQMGRDIGKSTEKAGRAIGNGIVDVHDKLDGVVENKVIPGVEEGLSKVGRETNRLLNQTKNEIQRFKKNIANGAENHIKEKSPTVRTITRIDDFIKQHPIVICSITAVIIASVIGANVRNFRDLFDFFSKLTSKRV